MGDSGPRPCLLNNDFKPILEELVHWSAVLLESVAADITAQEILNPDRVRHIRVAAPATVYMKRTITIFKPQPPCNIQARDRHTACSPLQIHSITEIEERKPVAEALTMTRIKKNKPKKACMKVKR